MAAKLDAVRSRRFTSVVNPLLGFDPVKALYWTAILSGVLAASMMAAMLLIETSEKIIGNLVLPWRMREGRPQVDGADRRSRPLRAAE
jgi:hypothetical protein